MSTELWPVHGILLAVDPHAPWQCGSNDNTNGLLSQILPKSANLFVTGEKQLHHVTDENASASDAGMADALRRDKCSHTNLQKACCACKSRPHSTEHYPWSPVRQAGFNITRSIKSCAANDIEVEVQAELVRDIHVRRTVDRRHLEHPSIPDTRHNLKLDWKGYGNCRHDAMRRVHG